MALAITKDNYESTLASGKPVVIEEVRKIEEDKVLPYLTNMFGKSLEIK